MRQINKYFFAVFLSVAVLAALNAQISVTMDIDPNAPVLKFEKDTIQYGTVAYNADGWKVMKITNTGKSPLIIQNLEAECGCTTVEEGGKKTWPQEPIAPGKSGIIKVHYDTKKVGTFAKRVTVKSNASSPSMVFVIKGEVLAEGVKPPITKTRVKGKPVKASATKATKIKTSTP